MKLLRATQRLHGVGIHSGKHAWIEIHPSKHQGYRFSASPDAKDSQANVQSSRAEYSQVTSTAFRTELAGTFRTVEHVLAALWGIKVVGADLIIGGDSTEVPILDGSALPFVEELLLAGLGKDERKKKLIRVQRAIRVTSKDSLGYAQLEPATAEMALDINIQVEFVPNIVETLGFRQDWLTSTADAFIKEIAAARTFANDEDVPALHRAGLGLGGTKDNCLVFDSKNGQVLNPPLRFQDERVRHKLLDVLGDLSLCNGWLIGKFSGKRTGHGMNHLLLKELFRDERNYEVVYV